MNSDEFVATTFNSESATGLLAPSSIRELDGAARRTSYRRHHHCSTKWEFCRFHSTLVLRCGAVPHACLCLITRVRYTRRQLCNFNTYDYSAGGIGNAAAEQSRAA
jgi:hypothetical protein